MIVDDVTCIDSDVLFEYESPENVNPDWDFGDGNASTLANPIHAYDTIGMYNVILTAIGPNGCANSVERAIEIVPLPEFELVAADSLCIGEPGSFLVNSGDDLTSYAWTFGDGESGAGQSLQYTYARQGTYTTSVTVTDAFGCLATQQQSVFVRPTPEAAFDFTQVGDCTPTEVSFTNQSTVANSYTWNFQDGNTSMQVNPQHLYTEGGNFNVQLIASFDGICFDTTTQNITINDIPNIDFQTRDLTCHSSDDGSIEVLDDQGHDITVYGDDFVQRGVNLFSGLEPGFYDIEVTAASGCDTTYTVEILEPDSLIMSVRLDTVRIVPGDTVRLEIFSNYTDLAYSWFPDTSLTQFGKNLFYAYPQRSVLYELTGTTGECSVRDFVYVEVDRERRIFIPNAFSPNGDGVNDFFYVFAGDGVEEVESLQIFQRFGDLVYQRENFDPNDPSAAWDGTHRGKMLNPAVFVYKAVIRFKDGRSEEFVGDVTLVR
jgi:gliding motility-associated-like protein